MYGKYAKPSPIEAVVAFRVSGPELRAHTSFPYGWKIWLCYKCGPYLTRRVIVGWPAVILKLAPGSTFRNFPLRGLVSSCIGFDFQLNLHKILLKVDNHNNNKGVSEWKCNSRICILNTPTFYVLRMIFHGRKYRDRFKMQIRELHFYSLMP